MLRCPALAIGSVLVLLSASNAPAEEETGGVYTVSSPGGVVTVRFSVPGGAPHYEVRHGDRAVILPSALGYVLRERSQPSETVWACTNNMEVAGASRRTLDETWEPVWGQASRHRNHYNELELALREADPPHRELRILFRAFDDGVGFRYVLPEQEHLHDVEILSEETRLRFTGDHTTWWIPANYDSYEDIYRTTPLSKAEAVNTPVTMKTRDNLYLSVHEANLTDYAGMTLKQVAGEPYAFATELVPWPEGVKVRRRTPLSSPWRTIQIADRRAGALIESPLILNLNEPCAIEDTSWIKPMTYVGIWWAMHIGKESWAAGDHHGATTTNAMHYIDFAARHGIGGVLVEGWNQGWDTWFGDARFSFTEPYPDFDLEEVAAYAREKGVELIGHHETGGRIPEYEAQMDAAFALYNRLGVRAVKTGYAGEIIPKGQHHHGQWMVNHYRRVVTNAAAHRIMIDAHEPIADTGISRTWPNMMTREGVRGQEYDAWSDGNAPEHTAILPFTRMLAGPLDYTPGVLDVTFERYRADRRIRSTLAKELALMVVLFSPLQMAADLTENYEGNPALAFIETLPTTWDETRVPHAAIGDYVTIARRKGDEWYVGSLTDEHARGLRLPLTFLSPDRTYTAHIYADAKDADWETKPMAVRIAKVSVTSKDTLKLKLARSGGQAIRLVPEP